MRSNWANLTIILLLSVCIITGCQWNTPVTTEPTNVTLQTTEQTVVTEESNTATLVTEATQPPTAPTEVTDPTEPEGIQEDKILEKYLPDYQQNQDLVGWIRLPGTRIDNPVLQTGVDNPNYYIDKNFDHQPDIAGALYVREECDIFRPSDNVVIYGHNMKNETMFGSLYRYRKQAHWEKNQYIYFDSLYEEHTYQIFAVFAISADPGNYPYHEMNEFSSAEEFDTFIGIVTNDSGADPAITQSIRYYYNTGLTPQYGDQLITLSTCEYTMGPNGRLVVIAYRIS